MARKVLLAFALLSVVIAVSYIKSVRGDADRREALSISEGAAEQLEIYEDNVDSLRTLVGHLDHSYAESLAQRDREYGLIIDSLFDALDSVECELDSHLIVTAEADLGPAKSDKPSPSPQVDNKKAAAEALKVRNQKILDFYKKQYGDLPADLTDYERKVSLYEIRLETARKYEITLTELKQIRSDAGLTY